ncbi:cation/calcium exchanger 5-like, partial [Fagus crenata]
MAEFPFESLLGRGDSFLVLDLRRNTLCRHVRLYFRGWFRGNLRNTLFVESSDAVGFVGFYVFFVGIVFWMDLGLGGGRGRSGESEVERGLVEQDCEIGEVLRNSGEVKLGKRWVLMRLGSVICGVLMKL